MTTKPLEVQSLLSLLEQALLEDCPDADITCMSFIPRPLPSVGRIVAKEPGIFFGEDIIRTLFDLLDPQAKIELNTQDGDFVHTGQWICIIHSDIHTLLKAERVLLNLLQRLSGIATLTGQFVNALNNPNIDVLDTRKTTPLLRFLEKKAVVAGGGKNHRFNLSDMALLKENHLAELEKMGQLHLLGELVLNLKQKKPGILVEIEVETLAQLRTLPLSDVDFIMFDNFLMEDIVQGIEICKEKNFLASLEVSGNITLETISRYRDLDIQRISVGSLTHSAKALDLSMRIE